MGVRKAIVQGRRENKNIIFEEPRPARTSFLFADDERSLEMAFIKGDGRAEEMQHELSVFSWKNKK